MSEFKTTDQQKSLNETIDYRKNLPLWLLQ